MNTKKVASWIGQYLLALVFTMGLGTCLGWNFTMRYGPLVAIPMTVAFYFIFGWGLNVKNQLASLTFWFVYGVIFSVGLSIASFWVRVYFGPHGCPEPICTIEQVISNLRYFNATMIAIAMFIFRGDIFDIQPSVKWAALAVVMLLILVYVVAICGMLGVIPTYMSDGVEQIAEWNPEIGRGGCHWWLYPTLQHFPLEGYCY